MSDGIRCSHCGSNRLQVRNTVRRRGGIVRRYRVCEDCEAVTTTEEGTVKNLRSSLVDARLFAALKLARDFRRLAEAFTAVARGAIPARETPAKPRKLFGDAGDLVRRAVEAGFLLHPAIVELVDWHGDAGGGAPPTFVRCSRNLWSELAIPGLVAFEIGEDGTIAEMTHDYGAALGKAFPEFASQLETTIVANPDRHAEPCQRSAAWCTKLAVVLEHDSPDESADTRADTSRKSPPRNPDVVDLCMKLRRECGNGKSESEIAREFTGESLSNWEKAKSLLRSARRHPDLWKR